MLQFTASFFLIGVLCQVHGQVCTWTSIQPPHSVPYVRSDSAPAYISMTVTSEKFPDGGRATWEGRKDGTVDDLSIMRYSASSRTFVELMSNPQGVGSSVVGNHNFTIPAVHYEQDGIEIRVVSGGCTSRDATPYITLKVKYCDLTFFEPEANSSNATENCGYNCVHKFNCNGSSPLYFEATCQDNAEWGEKTSPLLKDRCKFCDATFFETTAVGVDDGSATGVNMTKAFRCLDNNRAGFVAECQPNVIWNYTAQSNPCVPGVIRLTDYTIIALVFSTGFYLT